MEYKEEENGGTSVKKLLLIVNPCAGMKRVVRYLPDIITLFTTHGYENLVYLLQETYNKDGWQMKHKDLPIKFFSGKDDPCAISPSDFGKAIHFMKDLGYTDVRGAMYKGMRHEILNEKGRKRVYQDVYDFIKN